MKKEEEAKVGKLDDRVTNTEKNIKSIQDDLDKLDKFRKEMRDFAEEFSNDE